MSNWNDFNDAEQQQSFDLIPRNTAAKLRLTIKPGGFDDPAQGWTGGWAGSTSRATMPMARPIPRPGRRRSPAFPPMRSSPPRANSRPMPRRRTASRW